MSYPSYASSFLKVKKNLYRRTFQISLTVNNKRPLECPSFTKAYSPKFKAYYTLTITYYVHTIAYHILTGDYYNLHPSPKLLVPSFIGEGINGLHQESPLARIFIICPRISCLINAFIYTLHSSYIWELVSACICNLTFCLVCTLTRFHLMLWI